MNKKTIYATGSILVALFALGGIVTAAGVGPFGVKLGAVPAEIRDLIKGPEKLPSTDRLTGCDSSATTTDCATVRTSQAAEQASTGLSTASSYTEVASTNQSGKIDARLSVDNTLKGVSFCGTTFKTRQVIINGIDVGQRIAWLASNDQMGKLPDGGSLGQGVCNSMPHYFPVTKGILEMRDVTTFKSDDIRAPGDNYGVNIGTMTFVVNSATGEIFNVDAYDGSTLTSVGKLK